MMLRSKDPKSGYAVRSIPLKVTKEKLVGNVGLGTIVELFDKSALSREFAMCLPERKSNNSHGSYRMALILLSSLIHGDDCLDDIEEELAENPSAEAFFKGKIPCAKTFGDYLRDFEPEHIKKLTGFLTTMGYHIRGHLKKNLPAEYRPEERPMFNVDSTVHEQSGDKIEGCIYNYDGKWCLNSEVVYDEKGICYAGTLQAGNAKPGVDGPRLLAPVLAYLRSQKIENPFKKIAHVNADSAYMFEEFIRVCAENHASFTIAARATIGWESHVPNIETWEAWKYSLKEIEKFQKRKKPLPPRFLARWYWSPSWGPQLKFPVIIKKEWKEDPVFEGAGSWHYHAVITNEDLFHNSFQDVYERYLTRANMENFIKESKTNFDAYHMPCLKFGANHAYLLMLLIAQNLLRWVALITKPDKPHYAKKLRRKFIFAPGKLVSHSRQITLRVTEKFKKEVDKLKEGWQLNPAINPAFSTG